MFRLALQSGISGKDDLVLTFGPHQLSADTYYLAIDRDDIPGESPADRVVRVLGVMLHQWTEAIENCGAGETVYLPYDFRDDDTGWVECVAGEQFSLRPGRARLEGYKVWPNEWRRWEDRPPGFLPRKDVHPLEMTKEALLASIQASREGLKASPPHSATDNQRK